jgi:DNA polymerase III alpha subunit (gram-positive type)
MKYYLFVDTETGGLDPASNPVLELSASVYDETGVKVDSFHSFFAPYLPMDCKALSINGYLSRRPDLSQSPEAHNRTAVESFVSWSFAVAKKYNPSMVGHNIKFDIAFIDALVDRYGMQGWSKIFNFMAFDTMAIALVLKEVGILQVKSVGPCIRLRC